MILAAFAFNWYGFLIALGMMVGIAGAYFVAHWRGFRADFAFDVGIWAIICAIIGARLYVVITEAIGGNMMDFGQILGWSDKGFKGEYVGMQGLSIYGGIIGGAIGIFCNSLIYKHQHKPETFLNMLDLAAPFMILGQCIGRWGNLVNGELYGANPITNPAWQWWPFAIENGGQFYPALSFYESIFDLIGACLLMWLLIGKRRSRPGFVISIYFIFYGILRACLELQRDPQFMMFWGKLPVSFLDSIILILIGIGMLVFFIVKAKRDGKRIPILVKADDWAETGRSIVEWGRDFSKVPMPPLFGRNKKDAQEDEEDEAQEPVQAKETNTASERSEASVVQTSPTSQETVAEPVQSTAVKEPAKPKVKEFDDSDLL